MVVKANCRCRGRCGVCWMVQSNRSCKDEIIREKKSNLIIPNIILLIAKIRHKFTSRAFVIILIGFYILYEYIFTS